MAVLSWKDVNFNPVDTDGSAGTAALFTNSMRGLRESLGDFQKNKERNAGAAGIAEALKYGTPEEFRAAKARGDLQINPANVDFISNLEEKLLQYETTGITNKQSNLDYNQDMRQEAIVTEQRAAVLEAAPIIAQMHALAAEGKPDEARALGKENARVIALANLAATGGGGGPNTGTESVSKTMDAMFDIDKKTSDELAVRDKFAEEERMRAAKERLAPVIVSMNQGLNLGTIEGLNDAKRIMRENAELFAIAGIEPPDIDKWSLKLPSDAAAADTPITQLADAALAAKARENEAIAEKKFAAIRDKNTAKSPDELVTDVKRQNLPYEQEKLLLDKIAGAIGEIFPEPDTDAIIARKADEEAGLSLEARAALASQPDSSASLQGAANKLGEVQKSIDELDYVLKVDNSLGGALPSVIQSLTGAGDVPSGERANRIQDAAKEVFSDVPDVGAEETKSSSLNDFTKAVERIESKWGIKGVGAIELAKSATSGTEFYEFWKGNIEIDLGKVDEYMEKVLQPGENIKERLANTLDVFRKQDVISSGRTKIEKLQTNYNNAYSNLFSLIERANQGENVAAMIKAAKEKVDRLGGQVQQAIEVFRKNPVVTSNIAANPGNL